MNQMIRLLVADDDGEFLKSCLDRLFNKPDINIEVSETPDDCIAKCNSQEFDVIILDVSFSRGNQEGIELISRLKCLQKNAKIIMFSSYSDQNLIARSMKLGAKNYVVKVSEGYAQSLISQVNDAIEDRRHEIQLRTKGMDLAQKVGAVVCSEKMVEVFAKAYTAGTKQSNCVLITGPTGVGKELVAKAIHVARGKGVFKVYNCGAFPENLAESTLFGHVKGAFTGAHADKKGIFEAAHNGILFLDEVDTLPLKAQVALLRALQNGEFTPVGSTQTKHVNVQVISATNSDLTQKVAEGTFREDLLARLHGGIEIKIPPLAERREDIEPIIQKVLSEQTRKVSITPETVDYLKSYFWPQNVRQLLHVVGSMLVNTGASFLTIGDIPEDIRHQISKHSNKEDPSGTSPDAGMFVVQVPEEIDLEEATRLFQQQYFREKIKSHPGRINQRSLAKAVGLSKGSLQRRLKLLNINLERFKNDAKVMEREGVV